MSDQVRAKQYLAEKKDAADDARKRFEASYACFLDDESVDNLRPAVDTLIETLNCLEDAAACAVGFRAELADFAEAVIVGNLENLFPKIIEAYRILKVRAGALDLPMPVPPNNFLEQIQRLIAAARPQLVEAFARLLAAAGLPTSGFQMVSTPEAANGARSPVDVLILKGGGVKGLAFAGALIELERHFTFGGYVGTSAGAIAAVLLSAGFTAEQLEAQLREKDFRDFLDGRWWRHPWDLLVNKGLHSGTAIQDWIRNILAERFKRAADVRLCEFTQLTGKRVVLYASHSDGRPVVFDSVCDREETEAHFAARCSMSIPFFFQPETIDSKRVFDGGMLHNFPVEIFLADEARRRRPRPEFIGLYLGDRRPRPLMGRGLIADVLNVYMGQDEPEVLERHEGRVIVIDPAPITTVDFQLNGDEKELLVLRGQVAAIEFLRERNVANGPSDEHVQQIQQRLSDCEGRVMAHRQRRARRRRLAWWIGGVAVLAMVFGAVAWLTTRKPAQAADSTERPPLPSEPPPPVLNEPLPPIASDILRYDASRKHGPGPKSSFEIPLTEVAGWKRGTRFSLELELNGLGPDSFVMSGGETARSWAGILELTLGRKTVSWESGELSKSIDSRKITLDDCVRGSEELPVLVVSVASATRFSSENPNRDGGITLHFPRGRWVATPK